jgi:SagB-type dehydrogenase family enzyme
MRAILFCLFSLNLAVSDVVHGNDIDQQVSLPRAGLKGHMSVEEAIKKRRSVREFGRGSLALEDVSQLLWAAQGMTGRGGSRAAPSAGALYPLEIYVVAGNVEGLSPGVYRYRSRSHKLDRVASGERRKSLASAALGQSWVRRAPMVLVITGVYERTTEKYGQRGRRYVHIEVGHAAQNIYLQAAALGLGTVLVGAFHDSEVQGALDLPTDHEPLGLMPVGHER